MKSCIEIRVREESGAGFKFTLMGEAPKSWIVGNLRIPMWLHLLSDHFIEPYKIWWSSFE
jgi:hypothetical protein